MSSPSPAQIEALRLSIDVLVRVFKITDSPALSAGTPRLNPPDMQALLFVARHPDCIASHLGSFLGVAPTTISALVERLVRQGLMERARTDSNRRVVLLRLTGAGKAVVRQIVSQQDDHCRQMLSALTEAEREAFLQAAQKIIAAIS